MLVRAPKNSMPLARSGAIGFEGHADLRVLDETAAIPDPESDEAGLRWSLSGLHAKLYVVERNKQAHVFIGSANTTDAAWGGNDELLVEIVGRVGTYGVEATVGAAWRNCDQGSAASLLPHTLGDNITESAEDELRRTFENALRELAALTYTATVEGEHERPLLWVRSDEPLRAAASLPRTSNSPSSCLTLTAQPHRPVIRGAPRPSLAAVARSKRSRRSSSCDLLAERERPEWRSAR